MTDEQKKILLYAMLDLKALIRAEDWAEICELKDDASETLGEMMDAFPDSGAALNEHLASRGEDIV